MKNWIIHILFLLGLAGSWAGCTRADEEPWGSGEEDVAVMFNLNIPQSSSRTLETSDEEKIETIDVLAFVKSGSQYMYSYSRTGTQTAGQNLSFTVDLFTNSAEQVLVVLINARTELESVKSGFTPAKNIDDVLAEIIVENASEWPAKNDASETFRAIPMTGISAATVITRGMTAFPTPIELYRMLARINITTATGVNNFVLETAQVFNRVTKGYVGYKQALWNSKTAWVPTNGSGDPFKTPTPSFTYDVDANGEIVNQIYTLESTGVTLNNYMTSTAVVVGGTYTPTSGSPVTRYYRIDLTPNGQLSNSSTVDIVRNRSYDIEIQSVSSSGGQTPQEAYEGKISLAAEVKGWTDNENNVIIDGNYYLELSQATIAHGSIGSTVTIHVKTNYDANPNTGYPAGVELDLSPMDAGVATVTLGPNTGAGSVYEYDIQVVISDIPDSYAGDQRWTFFVIQAGNMRHQMAIWQWKGIWLIDDAAQSYAPGTSQYALKLINNKWQKWEVIQVDDPNDILVDAQGLVGRTGGGKYNLDSGNGIGEDYLYFYIRPSAPSGRTATLTFGNLENNNPPITVDIKTP